jgi:F-type H+-transporting ATPase subunit a
LHLKTEYSLLFLIKMNTLKTLKSTFFLLVVLLFSCSQTVFATGPKETFADTVVNSMMHHLGDANEFHIVGDLSIPLPCIAWSKDGLFFAMSSSFEHGDKAVNGYVLHHGKLMRVIGDDFPRDKSVALKHHHGHGDDVNEGGHHDMHKDEPGYQTVTEDGVEPGEDDSHAEEAHVPSIMYGGKSYTLEACVALQTPGSSWQDFSITKNVFAMLLALLLMVIVFSRVSKAYATREKQAPKGLQSFMEPIVVFMRDQVVKPAIGKKWQKFFPFIMSLFFFILFCNLLGLIPFFPGSANVTGNIGVTFVLAVFVFIMVNINGTKDYWMHILWMPGVPTAVKPLLTVIEVMSLFIKPATLFIRLFANIAAGHVIILSLVSLIFFFNSSFGMGGAIAGMTISIPFVFAMNLLELFVAFLQAFVFALLTALYIGSAVEEHGHHDQVEAH